MSAPNDGGPAFPVAGEALPTHMGYALSLRGGLTLRDWFAGKAPKPPDLTAKDAAQVIGVPYDDYLKDILRHYATFRAQWAYEYADAMLAARSTGRPG